MSTSVINPQGGGLVLRNRDTFAALGNVQRETLAILGDKTLDDISKGYATACAVQQFRTALSDDKVMAPIMALQGNPVGFLTDKDKSGGYDVATVRDCVITALMIGLRITGNEFNIIAGRCYATVNGCDRKLAELCVEPPLHEPGVVEFKPEEKRAFVDYTLTYRLRSDGKPTVFPQRIAVKLSFSREGALLTTDDAVIGKARRKIVWNVLRSVRGFDLGTDEGQVEKNITPSGPEPVGSRTSAKAAAARGAFATGPVVDADESAASAEGGAR